jgi:hypothetical protein
MVGVRGSFAEDSRGLHSRPPEHKLRQGAPPLHPPNHEFGLRSGGGDKTLKPCETSGAETCARACRVPRDVQRDAILTLAFYFRCSFDGIREGQAQTGLVSMWGPTKERRIDGDGHHCCDGSPRRGKRRFRPQRRECSAFGSSASSFSGGSSRSRLSRRIPCDSSSRRRLPRGGAANRAPNPPAGLFNNFPALVVAIAARDCSRGNGALGTALFVECGAVGCLQHRSILAHLIRFPCKWRVAVTRRRGALLRGVSFGGTHGEGWRVRRH